MKIYNKSFKSLVLSTILLSITAMANVNAKESTSKLLTAKFEPRKVVKIEAGDFHFLPGQIAPIHTHDAPAIGYVARGEIIYQTEGGKQLLLREGDAFYEPVGPRILRFDNASATEEAIFIDFNLQQEGEPYIVFEKEFKGGIDRRTLPTVDLDGKNLKQADVFVSELEPSASKKLNNKSLMIAYVAEGVIELKQNGKKQSRLIAGESFSLKANQSALTLINTSAEVNAKVVTFSFQ